ncbi:MAG TPA: DUF1697 domain-containing protein [Acidimicrobiales bacterium]|nr:DUF1697 domain-containing protein [Acidimicrobiales bacterium]
MARQVAMLRAVNVGGRSRLAMAELRAVFADLGYGEVQTYVQSGNVVFDGAGPAAGLTATIEAALAEALASPVNVLVRSHAQLAAVVDRNPLAGGGRDDSRLHVTFLAATPPAPRRTAIDPGAYAPDEFAVTGREVYLHCPGGYGRTKLTNAFFERALGVVATTRSLRTVTALVALSA